MSSDTCGKALYSPHEYGVYFSHLTKAPFKCTMMQHLEMGLWQLDAMDCVQSFVLFPRKYCNCRSPTGYPDSLGITILH